MEQVKDECARRTCNQGCFRLSRYWRCEVFAKFCPKLRSLCASQGYEAGKDEEHDLDVGKSWNFLQLTWKDQRKKNGVF